LSQLCAVTEWPIMLHSFTDAGFFFFWQPRQTVGFSKIYCELTKFVISVQQMCYLSIKLKLKYSQQ
jgi:hypothetical protein